MGTFQTKRMASSHITAERGTTTLVTKTTCSVALYVRDREHVEADRRAQEEDGLPGALLHCTPAT